ncbi:hypothetical protein H2200_001965 [Cladophialophora chaetospira]|uniref:Uncharacterized protein n=1 Tax=Cladophialophora chaetospira TaxID=386627 RepID=A0AA38XM01_9EURO|nr:hypothetical protein H2200_001965 [Cladophialophora chaetospira]
MNRLHELPAEILLALPLPRSDNANEFGLNGRWYYLPGGEDSDMKKRLPLLLNTLLSSYPTLAAQVHTMKFLTKSLGEPYWSDVEKWSAQDVLPIVASQLKHLFVVPDARHRYYYPWDTRDYPNLQTLAISNGRYNGLSIWHQKVLHIASQPKMRVIELHVPVGTDSSDYAYSPIVDPLTDTVYRTSKGMEMVVNQIQIEAEEIKDIIQVFGEIETFIYIKDTALCQKYDRNSIESNQVNSFCTGLSVQELDGILYLLRHSVQNLVLIQNRSDQCENDFTILQPLTRLVKLRNLRIDAHFLLGSHEWHDESPKYVIEDDNAVDGDDSEVWKPTVHVRSLSSLALLLPKGLERLDLQVRPDELFHTPKYCVEIIQVLVENNASFNQLNFITIEETHDHHRYNSPPPGESPVTEAMIRAMQNDCASVGIRLTYTKRGWETRTVVPKPFGVKRCGYVKVDAPFQVRVYEPGTDVKEINFLWRIRDPMTGYTVVKEGSED